MKTLIQVFLFFLAINCNAQEDKNINCKLHNLTQQIIEVKKKNDSLSNKIYEYNVSKSSFTEIIDKVDNLYNNNFNRFIIFWGIVASIIVIGVPYYITRIQKKIIEVKKAEILSFSTEEIKKLETKFSSELTQKYLELSDLISNSTQENKKALSKEFAKTIVSNQHIASKIHELEKKYDKVFKNLAHAVIKSNSIEYYYGANFHLKNISTNLKKFKIDKIQLDKQQLAQIAEQFKILRGIEEIDQELLENVIIELS